jgi:hypothetical protein
MLTIGALIESGQTRWKTKEEPKLFSDPLSAWEVADEMARRAENEEDGM